MSQSNTQPRFTNRALFALILPLILEQTFAVTIGMADTLMVSSVGEAAVSGVSLVDTINTLFIQILSALSAGGAVVTSQYLGRKDYSSAQKSGGQLFMVSGLFSLFLSVPIILLKTQILTGIYGSIEPDVMAAADTYFFLSALSYPFIALFYSGTALFRSQGNSKVSMIISLVMNVTNIGGNAILIYGFGMGVKGAAIASLFSRMAAAFAVIFLHQSHHNPLRLDQLSLLIPDREMSSRILKVGIPTGTENGMFQFGKLAVSHLTATLGTAAIAANAVANSTSSFLNVPGNAMGLAMITVLGQTLGAGDKEEAKRYARKLMIFAYTGNAIMNLAMLLVGRQYIIPLFNLSDEAIALCSQVVLHFNIISILCWPLSFTLPNGLRAGGDSKYTMKVGVLSMWLCRVGASYLLGGYLGFGLLGIWWGMFLDWFFRSSFFLARFFSGKWCEHKVI